MLNIKLKRVLQILESKLDFTSQNRVFECHKRILNWEETDRLPLIASFPYPKTHAIQPYPHREIFESPEKMLFNELVHAFDTSILLHSEINDDLPYTIRANFGTVIIVSLFGGKVEQRGDNPPWVRSFETLEEFNTVFDQDPLDFAQGICSQVIAHYKFYKDVLADYPNVQKCIKIVLPDLQGPLDSLELLRGSAVYEDFIMEPDKVEKGMHLMAQAQVGLAKHLSQYVSGDTPNYSFQHAVPIKGNILIRNDSAIMISPEMYAEQVAQHDEFVLNEMAGGGIHSCGRIDFNVPEILKLPSINCFDFGQSYLNNIDKLYPQAKEKKIPLLRYRPSKEELIGSNIMDKFPSGVSLVYEAGSFEEARQVVKLYKRT